MSARRLTLRAGRRRMGVALLLWSAAAVTGGITATRASATAPDAAGWWQRPVIDTAGTAVPLPDDVVRRPLLAVPSGGLYLANDASGPRSVAALRFSSGPTSGAALVLQVAGDPVIPFGAALVACAVAPTWAPVENGQWSDRPEEQCGNPIPGEFVDEQQAVRFSVPDLATFRTDRGYEFTIRPANGEVAAFAVAFEAPGPDALVPVIPGGPPTTTPVTDDDVTPHVAPPFEGGGTLGAPPTTSTGSADPAPGRSTSPSAISSPGSNLLVRIGTDGVVRAGLTATLALAAAGAWFASGRASRTLTIEELRT